MSEDRQFPKISLVGISAVGAAALAAVLIWKIAVSPGLTGFNDLASSRTILMLIIVLATVAFGGFLVNKSFTTDNSANDLDKRFQLSREIFLVFSGICGTVVGFYFGATDRAATNSAVAVSATLADDGSIVALIAGGAAPYKVDLVKGSASMPLAGDSTDSGRFTLARDPKRCPAGFEFKISGAGGTVYPAVKLAITEAELKSRNWICPEVSKPIASPSPSPTPTSSATQ